MRFLLSTVLIVGSTALFCHGWFNDDRAREALAEGGGLSEIESNWPYAFTTAAARSDYVAGIVDAPPPRSRLTMFEHAWGRLEVAGFDDRLPFVMPHGLAAIAVAALLLAVALPGTRFRGLALLLLLLGAAACWPAYLDESSMASYVVAFEPLGEVIAWFPLVAVGLTFLAGVVVGCRRPPRHAD